MSTTIMAETMSNEDINTRVTSRSTISGSSMAPTDFHLSQSFENSSNIGNVSVALERCLLCAGSRRSFYCKSCVREGTFIHSRNMIHPFQQLHRPSVSESYVDKSNRWKMLKQEREHLVERFRATMAENMSIHNQRTEVYMRRQRIQQMKAAFRSVEENVNTNKQQLSKLVQKTSDALKKAEYHIHERQKFNSYLTKLSASIERRMKECSVRTEDLIMLRRQGVRDLVKYIFPITEIQPKSDSHSAVVEDVHQSTVSLLADARRTAYIKGRWIITDSGYEQQYRIVMPTLPGSGNYSLAMVDNKDLVSPSASASAAADMECQADCNPSHTIRAALCLTAQLVSLVAVYLNVVLPRRIHYSEFCFAELTERRFSRLVLGLDLNVLSLCFTQRGVNIRTLEPHNTLGNLLAVLNSPELGVSCACCIDDDETAILMHSIECSLFEGLVSNEAGSSAGSHWDEDSDSLEDTDQLAMTRDNQEEWEQVSTMLPEAEMMSTSPGHNTLPSYFSESHSNVASLMSSAASSVASSVASFWRWGRTSEK